MKTFLILVFIASAGSVVAQQDGYSVPGVGAGEAADPAERGEGPKIRMPVAKPYKAIDYCPRGAHPVIYDKPKRGDMLCDRNHRLDDWEKVPQGEGPRISLAVDDPFQPYKQVGTCPPDKHPVLVDWPKPGDMICQ